MIRPIESNISLYNVDFKAHQMQNDPEAHTAQAMHQGELVKQTIKQAQTVQKTPESEGEVKIGERNPDRRQDGRGKKRRRDGQDEEPASESSANDGGGLNFLA
jgi:hypothetical protein